MESLNFQISMLIYGVVAFVVLLVVTFATFGLGLVLVVPVGLAWLVFEILVMVRGSQAATAGREYRYPLTIRFVR